MPTTIPNSTALFHLRAALKAAAADGELSDSEIASIKQRFKPVAQSLTTEDQVDALLDKVKQVTSNLAVGWSKSDAFEADLSLTASRRKGAIAATRAIDREFP